MSDNPHNILVVEAGETLQTFLNQHLHGNGYHVQTIASGGEMFDHLRHDQPYLILLDLNLPDSDGLNHLHQIQEQSPVPVIVAALQDKRNKRDVRDDRINALRQGAEDYLTNSCEPIEIAFRIRFILNRKS